MNNCKECKYFILLERDNRVHQFCVAKEPQQTPKVNCAFFESAQYNVQRTAIAWFFIGGFVFLGIRWLVFGG